MDYKKSNAPASTVTRDVRKLEAQIGNVGIGKYNMADRMRSCLPCMEQTLVIGQMRFDDRL